MKKSINFKNILFYAAIIALILFTASWFSTNGDSTKLTYSQVVDYFNEKQVKSFTVDGDDILVMKLKDGTEKSYQLSNLSLFYNDLGDTIKQQHDSGIITDYNYLPATQPSMFWSIMPYILMIALMVGMWFFIMNAQGGGNKAFSFGKSRAKMYMDEKNKKTFADVAGADEEKQELAEVVDFLKNPAKYVQIGARVPKGILLFGQPGTGKTLLAKAVAGEAGVPFFSISGSDFVEMFVGVGASRVRDLFEQAKKNLPCIIFIDEIDAVGRHRGAGLGGGHDEREQTLNQLLVEMDGFGTNEGIIIIAATNRPDILDPALLRPGRFDRQITVGAPDMKGREEILKVHAKGKPLDEKVDLADVAKGTVGFTGADLENVLNEAALLAARRDAKTISQNDIEDATIRVIVGPEKKSHKITEKDKRITAYHECGHAILGYCLETQDPVHEISIIPRGMANGYTLSLPQEDKTHMTKREMTEEIVVLLGGRAAEELVIGDVTTGASNDIERATDTAKKMVTRYGMSDKLGLVVYGNPQQEVFLGRDFNHEKTMSEAVAAEIDAEVTKIISKAYTTAKEILTENMNKLHSVSKVLLEKEKLSGEEFTALMKDEQKTEE